MANNNLNVPKKIDEAMGFVPFQSLSTRAIHAGYDPLDHKSLSCPVVPPISLSTTFQQSAPAKDFGFDYSRAGNPSRAFLEKTLASLEDAKFATVFSSGCAAQSALVQRLTSGDLVICNDDVYGGTNRFFRTVSTKAGIIVEFVNLAKDLSKLKSLIQDNNNLKMIWIETPTNPLMKLVDIEAVTKIVKDSKKKMVVVVDNTFMSSIFQHPLDFGADISLHSMTKYMNGHSDVVMGCCITNDAVLNEELVYAQKAIGAVPSPFDCFLALRGLRTLSIRMREHMSSGLIVANFLVKSSMVEKVIHPGLESHPQHKLAKKQMRGYSGMISAYLKDINASDFVSALRVFVLAESLGGFESLAEVPSIMTHASVPEAQRIELGITDNFVRFSVGLEDVSDLIADIEQAFQVAQKKKSGTNNSASPPKRKR